MHKDAVAGVSYTANIWYWEGEEQHWPAQLEGATVMMRFCPDEIWTDWEEATETAPGNYKIVRDDEFPINWEARIDLPDVEPINPDTNPASCTTGYFVWEVLPL